MVPVNSPLADETQIGVLREAAQARSFFSGGTRRRRVFIEPGKAIASLGAPRTAPDTYFPTIVKLMLRVSFTDTTPPMLTGVIP